MKTRITLAGLCGLALTAAVSVDPAAAENWQIVSRSSTTVYLVDVDSIAEAAGVTTVRLARAPSAGDAGDLSHTVGEVAFRCAANQARAGAEVVYGPDGAEQERIDDGYDFEAINAHSLNAYVKQMACDGDRAPGGFPSIRAFVEAGRPGAD